jgi:hypothetical protein
MCGCVLTASDLHLLPSLTLTYQGGGDVVTARAIPDKPGVVVIEGIEGDGGRLTLDPAKNCVGVAATAALQLIGQPSCGVALRLKKVAGRVGINWG